MAYATRLFSAIFAALFVVHVVTGYIRGTDPFASYAGRWPELLAAYAGVCAVAGMLLFALLRFWSATVSSDGLHGRSYWGRRRTITWSDAVRVYDLPVEGIPAMRVESASGRDVFFAYLAEQVPMLRTALLETAGAEHPVTLHLAR